MSRIVAIAVAALILAACATSSQVEDLEARIAELEAAAEEASISTTIPTFRDIPGTLTTSHVGSGCAIATGEFVINGDTLTIHDGSDAVLAIGQLTGRDVSEDDCVFSFLFPGVPTDSSFYRIRLEPRYWEINRTDFKEADWTADITSRP